MTPNSATGAAPSPHPPREEGPADPAGSPENAVKDLHRRISELIDYAAFYFATRIDAAKVALKRRIVTASIIMVAVLVAAGAIVTATVLVCEGLCDGFSDLLHHRWAGELVTGLLLLAIVAGGGFFGINRIITGSHRRTYHRYEQWRQRQREKYGRDITGQRQDGTP